ncbi:putative 3-methyladenine DNA glycosylase AlkA [Agromyces rhizosphaerae]|uniref:DNA-3-methyladenine glycosylase II n=1 Tax=Agromyces rhizosphaerae TaxID=88374 RepID=A0A9W6CUD7_9MICO|nr:AlkA N-terminal domain-containing protein [Agromyces rhizosphaerae]GLI25880.1 putative 3-methyladenine DNA glycosylase AlkA [Agromyces rhizosphaerae]
MQASDRMLDPDFRERYRAMSSRDARFDGQFITGVHSTGIYCRPSCPATTPKPEHVRFYLTAAAAHEAGLRACKRCLPDAVPGSPRWDLDDDLASRAMRLIGDGVVEREGVPGLAGRLGYTPRHLGRILTAELGAGPLALARAHRAQTARALLVGSDLPVADIAFAAGFGSVRQCNDTVRAVYERTPSELREIARSRRGAPEHGDAGQLVLRLPARAPFDAAGVLDWLDARAVDGMERADDGTFTRALRLPGGPALVRLEADPDDPGVRVTAHLASLADLPPLVARVRRLFDLDADAEAISAALGADPALAASVAAEPGMRVPGCLDPHELLFRAMLGQQVSVASARTALGRLVAALGDEAELAGATWRLFPDAATIAERGGEVLRGPAARVAAIVGAAEALAAGDLRVDVDVPRDELRAALLAMPGIGPWTAGYVAMRVTGDPDVLLTGDAALRAGAAALGLPSVARELERRGATWAPWRSYASMHLWRAASAHTAGPVSSTGTTVESIAGPARSVVSGRQVASAAAR